MTSPEAFLRQQMSFVWPEETVHVSVIPDAVELRSPIPLRFCVATWDEERNNFLGCIRAYRYNFVPENWEELLSYGAIVAPSFARRVLFVVNQGWFLSEGVPLLNAVSNSTPIDGVTAVSFTLAGSPGPEPFQYILPRERPPEGTWNGYHECLCIAFLFEPGKLEYEKWTALQTDGSPWGHPVPDTQPATLLPTIIELCRSRRCCRAAISDGTSTLLLWFQIASDHKPEERRVVGHIVAMGTEALPFCLAFLLYIESVKSGICGMHFGPGMDLCRGALNDPLKPLHFASDTHWPESLSEFDLYSMQRDERHWEQFTMWRAQERVRAIPLVTGDILVADCNSFVHKNTVLRSPVPFPDVPADTLHHVLSDPRPVDVVARRLTMSGSTFTFRIHAPIRAVDESYSQVFVGTISGQDGEQSGNLCLKLYDERYFHVPTYSAEAPWLPFPSDPLSDPVRAAQVRLHGWTVAEDLARREESAYDRLQAFQGSLIPHSYGFHQFTFHSGHRCLGFLMEFVEGMSVEECGVRNMPRENQRQFILNARHGLRVLRYAQIHQADWHSNQFIVQKWGGTEAETCRFGLVFIDFALAFQHMNVQFTPTVKDWSACRNCFLDEFEFKFLFEQWFEQDENEY